MSLIHCIKNNLKAPHLRRMHYLMGTFLSIEIFYLAEDKANEVIEAAFNEVSRLEALLSRFRKDSQVSRINNLAHIQPKVIDEEIFSLIEDCLEFSRKSNSTFDITVTPLIDLWSRAEKIDSLPKQEEIRSLLQNIGYQNIILDEEIKTTFFKIPFLKLDFGAVGKGYALDRAVDILKEKGIRKARLDFGGQLYYLNQIDSEEDYIGIRNPLNPDEIITSLALKNQSISTSANYERNLRINNKIYSHIFNPITGYPVDNNILSVSVISSSALLADIYSTTIYILGLEDGLKLIENMDDLETIIITDDEGEPKINRYKSQNHAELDAEPRGMYRCSST